MYINEYDNQNNPKFIVLASMMVISTYMPKAETVIRKGYSHCGYMAAHRKEYVEELQGFIGGKQ